MKEILAGLIKESETPLKARNVMREYLQARILACLQREGAMVPLAFHGGTALRFLFALPRHSEDLDFALEGEASTYDIMRYVRAVMGQFHREGYDVDSRMSQGHVVESAWFHFRGLLFELGLSAVPEQRFSIKLEVDTQPPNGAGLGTTVIRRYVILQVQHHDRASLLAGKLHAILQRKYAKGRDVYDLLWYLSDPSWPDPNLELLNHALTQTAWKGPKLTMENWRRIVQARIETFEWRTIQADVAPFLEQPEEIDLLTRENLIQLLGAPTE